MGWPDRKHFRKAAAATAVVLGNGDGPLGVIHSLAKAGLDITCVFTNPHDWAHRSRFVRRSFLAPPPEKGAGLLRLLLDIGKRRPGAFLIPCSEDPLVRYVARHREALLQFHTTAVPPAEILEQLMDKSFLYRHAVDAGVPVPRTWLPGSVDELRERCGELSYPCLLKPVASHRFLDAYGKKLLVANSGPELLRHFTDARRRGIPAMLTEIVPGDDASLFHYRSYLDREGRVLAEMCTQKLRQHPAGFGVACFSRTIPMIPEIKAYALSLLHRVGYSGVSSAEFKRNADDGRFKLMEINVRPVLPERLFAEAGVNFSAIAYRDSAGLGQPPLGEYETGVYWVHNFLETIRLLYHRNLSIKDYLIPYRKRGLVTCVPFLRDPVPFLGQLWKIAEKAFKLILGMKTP